MAFKFLAFAALLATARAGLIGAQSYAAAPAAIQYAGPAYSHAAPVAYAAAPAAQLAYAAPAQQLAYAAAPVGKVIAKTVDADYDPNPQYSYAYDVQDGLTGDSKSQQESRNGDVVQGSYSLVEADGTRRIVEYTADPQNGFNAVVHKEPAQVAVKAIAAAPATIVKAHAPVAYQTPIGYPAQAAYAAPAAYAAHGYHL